MPAADINYLYMSVLGAREGMIVRTLVEERPKWVLLLLYLRKLGILGVSEAKRIVRISYDSLRSALKYLGGVELGRNFSPIAPAVTPIGLEPAVKVIRTPGNRKMITLTEYGLGLASKVVDLLKRIALGYGAVDVERKYGIPRVIVMSEISSRFPGGNPEILASKVVSLDELVINLSKSYPHALPLVRMDLIDAVPIELDIAVDRYASRRLTLYVVV